VQCKMTNTMSIKDRSKFDKFTTVVRIKIFNFLRKLIFNHSGKLDKDRRHIRLIMHRIKPSILGKIIDKKYIIVVAINRGNR